MDKSIFANTMRTLFSFFRTRGVAFFLASLMVVFGVGCQRYAFPQVLPEQIGTIDEGGFKNKHFIVHAGANVYDLTNLATNSKILTGAILPVSKPIYYDPYRTEPYTKAEKAITNEVHIFLNSRYDSLALGAFTVPYVDISDVRVIKNSNPEGAVVAIVLGISFLTLLIWVGLSSFFEGFHPLKR